MTAIDHAVWQHIEIQHRNNEVETKANLFRTFRLQCGICVSNGFWLRCCAVLCICHLGPLICLASVSGLRTVLSTVLLPTIFSFCPSSSRLSAAEPFHLAPLWSGMHCLTTSFHDFHHHPVVLFWHNLKSFPFQQIFLLLALKLTLLFTLDYIVQL